MIRAINTTNQYMSIHGHDRVGYFIPDEKFAELIQELYDLDFSKVKGLDFNYISKKQVKQDAFDFITSHYNIHDVGYMPNKKVIKCLRNKNVRSIDDLIEIYNKSIDYISPFELPIKYNIPNLFGGTLVTQVVVVPDDTTEYLDNLDLAFTNIRLSRIKTIVTSDSYIHELSHALIESNKGIVEEFYNGEVVSIFNELVYAYNKDKNLFYLILYNRLNNLFNTYKQMQEDGMDFAGFNYNTDIKYILGILKAVKLMCLYLNKDEDVIKYIGETFDAKKTLETVLDDLDVTNESVIDSTYFKRLVK